MYLQLSKRIPFNLARILPKNIILYRFCRRYVNNFDGDNNHYIHQNGELDLMNNVLRKCKVIFDVGAHIGEWTNFALAINKNLEIHCFEPSKFTFKKLIANNFPPNVTTNNFGLSSTKGEKSLYIFNNGSGLNSLYKRSGLGGYKQQDKVETVQLDTLEHYCIEKNIKKIDYLKIDAEGHELDIIKGGKSLFKNGQVNMIQFEYGGTNIDARVLLKDFFEFFEGMGYYFFKIFPNHIKFIKEYNIRFENFKYQNWVVIKRNCLQN